MNNGIKMRVEWDETKFMSKAEWRRTNGVLGMMDKEHALRSIKKHGWKIDAALRVSDLMAYLQTLDPDAKLVYGEDNGAMTGSGYWQHMVDFMLPQCIRTVKTDKERLKTMYVRDDMTDEDKAKYGKMYDDKDATDYQYVEDDDIIVQI